MEREVSSPTVAPRQKVRLVFMGTPAFAAIVLEGLLRDGWRVGGAVCQPDRPKGRGRKVVPPPAKVVAEAYGVPIWQPSRMKDPAFLEFLRALAPDLVVVAAFGRILPGEVLSIPPLGCYNVHGSLLPAYRGAAPIPWAIIRGEKVTGITLFRMDEGMDTGDMLAAESLAIEPEETAGALTERLARLAVKMLPGALEEVVQGRARLVRQDHSKATLAPILRKSDGEIAWSLSAEEIRTRIRGLDPWPGAYTHLRDRRLLLWKSTVVESGRFAGSPGEVLEISAQGLLVATGQDVLRVTGLQLEGGRRMTVGEFLRGHEIEPGQKLG
ncbi:MAG: methionyl-tRNA formyltransferase [bacterium]